MVRRLLPIVLALIFTNVALPCDGQERGWIGVDLQDLTAERARELRLDPTGGALVVDPRRNGPAQQAGLLAGDVILALDDLPVRNMAGAIDYIGARPPGTRLKISIWRDGERRELLVTLERFPDALALLPKIQELINQQKYAEAIPLAERLVETTRSNPGPRSADHVLALDRLAGAYYALGYYSEAEPLYRSMIAIMQTARGPEHDDVAVGLGHLGDTLNRAGRHSEAVEVLRRAVAIREKALGPEHANLAWTLEKLADALLAIGSYSEAEVIARRAMLIWDKTQPLPSSEPIPRIETGMHVGRIWRIGVDAACRLFVTGSADKTARLWELPEHGAGKPRLVHALRVPIGDGNDGEVRAVALSPDGQVVAAGGWNRTDDHRVYIFDATSGRLLRRLDKFGSPIQHLVFSADGKFLAATLHGGEGMRVWETTSWSLVGQDRDYGGEPSYGATFDAAGKLYTVAHDGFLRRYGPDFKLAAKSRTLGGGPYSVAVHPTADLVAVGYANTTAVDVYRATDLAHLFDADTQAVENGHLSQVAWSADGYRLYAGGSFAPGWGVSTALRIWDQEGHGKPRDVIVASDTIAGLLPCGDAMAVAAQDPAFGLISLAGEKQVWQEANTPDMRIKYGEYFTVSSDGSKVRFGLGFGGEVPILFDLVAAHLADSPERASGLAPPDIDALKLTDLNSDTPKNHGKPLELDRYDRARSAAVAPGANRFVLGTEWSLRAYDNGGKRVWRKGVPGSARGVNVTPNGKFVLAAYSDGTIRWHRLADGEEVLALFVHRETREWVLWTPQGYYASSPAGDQYIGWHLNKGWDQAGEFVTAARLKQHLYRPVIIKRAFELADAEMAVREAGLHDFKLADLAVRTLPQFRIIDPPDKARADRSPLAVRLEVASANDPVTGFDIKVNGRQVTPRTVRDLARGAVDAGPPTLNIPLEKGENRIQITARNDVGETVNELLVYLDRGGMLEKKGRLFVLAVGVDNYARLGLGSALHYAGADARLIVDTLTQKAGPPLHAEVKSKLLVSGADMPPTKANIEDALLLFREAKPEDTVILFLAGHGVNEGANYLFMPEDAQRTESGEWRPSSVVRWHVLQQALQEAHGNRIMFVDTCHARGAFSPRLVKDASDANIVVFSATDKETQAQERSELGHGVFTYALSEGLKGGADFTKKGAINILPLGHFVWEEVKRLTNDEQEPTFNLSQVKNFVVAAP
jgi:WD40 repeat protein